MAKKAVKKTAKPLASALTVANPVRSKPGPQPELPKEPMAAKGIPNPAESTIRPKLTCTPTAIPPKLATPLARTSLPPIIERGLAKQSVASAVETPKSPMALPKESLASTGEPAKLIPQLPPEKLSGTPAAAENPPTQTTPRTMNVVFILNAPQAKKVSLCGAFNQWAVDAALMIRQDDGFWKVALDLRPGRYEYKYVVDGQWIHDPLAHEHVWNRHGTLNSVVEVRA